MNTWVKDDRGNRCSVERFGSIEAAQLIYSASGYEINPCRFYDDNKEALEDMKRLAEVA